MGRVENVIQLAQIPELILCCYGNAMRVPTANSTSPLKTKADVRMAYFCADAIKLAHDNPQRQVVFLLLTLRQRHR